MGVSGSGKSTVARALAERLGWEQLEGDDVQFEHGASDELVVHAPAYVDLPLQFVIKYLRVSTDAERAHLHAEKHELDATSLALTLIGDADQFYFIAGGGVSCRRTR